MVTHPGIAGSIGKTPLVHLQGVSKALGIKLLAKIESMNPGGSIKDRVAAAMVHAAEAAGQLRAGATLIEPTSGNTGIALAMIAASRGYELILVMPEAMSRERVSLLRAYGARVVLTPGTLMQGAVEQARLLGETTPDAVMLKQFENPANPQVHQDTTAEEIWTDTHGQFDVLVAGIGTGGTITGVARALKPRLPGLRVVGIEPAGAAVLSGGKAGQHHIQGIGAGFIPPLLERHWIDELVTVEEGEALDAARWLARTDGILAGISSGANLSVVMKLSRRAELQGKRFVMMVCDGGERYLSTALFKALSD